MVRHDTEVRSVQHYPMIELMHGEGKTAESVSHRADQMILGKIGLQAVLGGRAFREYHALSERIGVNKVGNFRGMVVSARWKTLFRHTSHIGEYLENVGYLAAMASGIAEEAPKFESIVSSFDSAVSKGLKISDTASTIA